MRPSWPELPERRQLSQGRYFLSTDTFMFLSHWKVREKHVQLVWTVRITCYSTGEWESAVQHKTFLPGRRKGQMLGPVPETGFPSLQGRWDSGRGPSLLGWVLRECWNSCCHTNLPTTAEEGHIPPAPWDFCLHKHHVPFPCAHTPTWGSVSLNWCKDHCLFATDRHTWQTAWWFSCLSSGFGGYL